MAQIMERNPLTEQEVYEYLDKKVQAEAAHWGEDYIYTQWAREARDRKMEQFRRGEVVEVYTVTYCAGYGNGTGDYSDTLYSDGTVRTACYGYID